MTRSVQDDVGAFMFINVADELEKARKGKYCLGAFNTANLEVTKAICAAAKKTGAAVIIQTTPSAIEYAGLQQIFDIVKNEIEETGVSAAIHLDHGKNFEIVRDAIDVGYRSVMIDGSDLSFEENVALTKRAVEYAHQKNVAVEGEIGVITTDEGGAIKESAIDSNYSSAEITKKFVDLTGVDSVAISVGNKHGAPAREKINRALLEEISQVVSIPIVMHGSSGISNEDLQFAIEHGVAKTNVDTNIRRAFIDGMLNIGIDVKDYREVLKNSMANVERVVTDRINLLGGM